MPQRRKPGSMSSGSCFLYSAIALLVVFLVYISLYSNETASQSLRSGEMGDVVDQTMHVQLTTDVGGVKITMHRFVHCFYCNFCK